MTDTPMKDETADALRESLGPNATIIPGDWDGFPSLGVLAGNCVYLQQGEARIVLARESLPSLLAALSDRATDQEGVTGRADDLLLVDHYYPFPWTLVEPADDNGAAFIRDRKGGSVAMMMWPAHGPDDAQRASEATYQAGQMMAAVAHHARQPIADPAREVAREQAVKDRHDAARHHMLNCLRTASETTHVWVRRDAVEIALSEATAMKASALLDADLLATLTARLAQAEGALQAQEDAEGAREECPECYDEGPWEHCGKCSVAFGEAIDLRRAALATPDPQAEGGAA